MESKPLSRPNYVDKVFALAMSKGVGFHDIDVFHDDWCAMLQGGICNCNPDVRVRPLPEGRKAK